MCLRWNIFANDPDAHKSKGNCFRLFQAGIEEAVWFCAVSSLGAQIEKMVHPGENSALHEQEHSALANGIHSEN